MIDISVATEYRVKKELGLNLKNTICFVAMPILNSIIMHVLYDYVPNKRVLVYA